MWNLCSLVYSIIWLALRISSPNQPHMSKATIKKRGSLNGPLSRPWLVHGVREHRGAHQVRQQTGWVPFPRTTWCMKPCRVPPSMMPDIDVWWITGLTHGGMARERLQHRTDRQGRARPGCIPCLLLRTDSLIRVSPAAQWQEQGWVPRTSVKFLLWMIWGKNGAWKRSTEIWMFSNQQIILQMF